MENKQNDIKEENNDFNYPKLDYSITDMQKRN